MPEVIVVASTGRRGLSGARNTGVGVARSQILAFLDDDAWAEDSWIERSAPRLREPRCRGLRRGGGAGPRRSPPGLVAGRVRLDRGLLLSRPSHQRLRRQKPHRRQHVRPPPGRSRNRRLRRGHRPGRFPAGGVRGDRPVHPPRRSAGPRPESSTSPRPGCTTRFRPTASRGGTSGPGASPRGFPRPRSRPASEASGRWRRNAPTCGRSCPGASPRRCWAPCGATPSPAGGPWRSARGWR